MRILIKIILFPIAILCLLFSLFIGLLGSIAQWIIGIISGLSGLIFLTSLIGVVAGEKQLSNVITFGILTFLLIFITVTIEALPAFLSNISNRIFEL